MLEIKHTLSETGWHCGRVKSGERGEAGMQRSGFTEPVCLESREKQSRRCVHLVKIGRECCTSWLVGGSIEASCVLWCWYRGCAWAGVLHPGQAGQTEGTVGPAT